MLRAASRRAGQQSASPQGPVEDLLTRNGLMLTCELTWLALFVTGLQA